MESKNRKRIFITLFALLYIISFVFAGCSNTSNAPEACGSEAQSSAAASNVPVSQQSAQSTGDGVSYISIDVNPSIQLTVKFGVVLEAKAYNDDGTEILLVTDVLGKTPTEATKALIDSFIAGGYITMENPDAAVVITVCGNDEEKLLDCVKQAADGSLSGVGITCDVVASDIPLETVQTAKSYGLTPGKYLVIQYLAKQDGISIEAAKEKYGSMKMKALLGLVADITDVYGDDAYISEIVKGLTPEQMQILTQAKQAYSVAMKNAVNAYLKAKSEAREYFQTAKKDAQEAYKSSKDQKAWQQARKTLKQEFKQRYEAAKQAFVEAKTKAKEAFMTAVASLGLDEDTVKALLEWDFDLKWDFEPDLDQEEASEAENEDKEDTDKEDKQEPGSGTQGGNNGHSGQNNGKGKKQE